MAVENCPTCGSRAPELHPAVQHEGEVQPCQDPWHRGVELARVEVKASMGTEPPDSQTETETVTLVLRRFCGVDYVYVEDESKEWARFEAEAVWKLIAAHGLRTWPNEQEGEQR